MEKNPELSLTPEPEQSQDRMDSSSQGILNEPFCLNTGGLGVSALSQSMAFSHEITIFIIKA